MQPRHTAYRVHKKTSGLYQPTEVLLSLEGRISLQFTREKLREYVIHNTPMTDHCWHGLGGLDNLSLRRFHGGGLYVEN